MAPEQCLPGELGAIGHASDMWAFGATMFRAAAGYRAFDREPRWLQLTEEPYLLPDFVPPALGDLIYACLSRDPGDRPLPDEAARGPRADAGTAPAGEALGLQDLALNPAMCDDVPHSADAGWGTSSHIAVPAVSRRGSRGRARW